MWFSLKRKTTTIKMCVFTGRNKKKFFGKKKFSERIFFLVIISPSSPTLDTGHFEAMKQTTKTTENQVKTK